MGIWVKIKELFKLNNSIEQKNNELSDLELKLSGLKKDIEDANSEKIIARSNRDKELNITHEQQQAIIQKYAAEIETAKRDFDIVKASLDEVQSKFSDTAQKLDREKYKLKTAKALYKKVQESLSSNFISDLSEQDNEALTNLIPTVELPLHSHNIKELKALIRQNNKILEDTLIRYEKRYTTKTNKAIYELMVIALRAELQNILINMKYSTLDKCIRNMKDIIDKYLKIATDGNQTIAPTLNSFIAEIDVLFNRTIEIEYEYYVQKEKEKAEQQALREQMRQEAEERKALENQKKQVEKEAQKYKDRIADVEKQITETSDNEIMQQLQSKIAELQKQLASVEEQKEEIIKLQNGKAGYVYVISNLGSFGENTFKIGMTRRLEPMDRIKELSSASVPFVFDVHSFIFSDDAVGLENKLHTILNDKRTNKINLRKEFFNISIDELEKIVQDIDDTAEFNRTMLASEYRQTLEMNLKQ